MNSSAIAKNLLAKRTCSECQHSRRIPKKKSEKFEKIVCVRTSNYKAVPLIETCSRWHAYEWTKDMLGRVEIK